MLERKGVEHRIVDILPGFQPVVVRLLGFPAITVPALRFDGRRATFPVLPAADQCGYRAYLPSFGVAEPELQLGGR